MKRNARNALFGLVSGLAILLAACGGGGGKSGGGGGSNPTTPTVTVTPANPSITTLDSLSVVVTVRGTSSTPTGAVTLTSGTYSSSATTLSGGAATITVPAGKLAAGTATLTASYTADSASSSSYNRASGTAPVTVTQATATVTVAPASSTIGTSQALDVTVTVAGSSGGPTPTGSVTLTSGTYSSGAKVLTNGSATISIPANTLAAGTAQLMASYSPDTAGSAVYGSASGTANVTVTSKTTPTVSLASSQSVGTWQPLPVTVKVKDPNNATAVLTGSVALNIGTKLFGPTPLTNGSATITVPAYSMGSGSYSATAAYTPDQQSSYSAATSLPATLSVAPATPTITVTTASLNITPLDALEVTVVVGGGAAPAGLGSIILSSGGQPFTSATLDNSGSATVNISAGSLASGSNILTASYTPDTNAPIWYKPNSGTSAARTVSSLVTVNPSTTLASITDQLMGMNLAAWYDVVGNASSINAAFGKAGIKAIRWPGGSWSDAYHWGDGGTPVSKCKNPNDTKDGTWPGVVTFAPFMTSIVKRGQYDLALIANYGSNVTCNGPGDPQEAADWAAEALKEGWAASHMTVGNENYGTWEIDLHQLPSDRWNPTTYANSVIGNNGFYKVIKTASPTTKVGVVVDAGGIQSAWDSTVLSVAKGSYDFVEYHIYPKDPGQEDDTYLVHTAAQKFAANLTTIQNEMTTAGVNVPIYVGEMGSVSSNPGKQSWSITQGLYAGQTLGEMMNAGVVRATWWIGFGNCNQANGNMSSSLYGWQTFGAYNIFSDGPSDGACGVGSGAIGTLNPTAQAFNLFKNLAVTGESALSTSVSGDKDNIRAYSATHSGGTALLLFNLNQNQSQPVTITLSAQSASSGVSLITYDKAIYDKTNPANAGGTVWADPTTTDLGAQNLPFTLTLTPWSMNVVIIK
jgi:Bacterial Ig-like domain (group 3)